MGTLRLYFVRHAPVIRQDGIAYGREAEIDTNCSALFEKAAGQLPLENSLWVASEFPRAQKTANILQAILGSTAPLTINAAFNEQDFGDLAGRRKSDIRTDPANAAYLANKMEVAPPNGESIRDMTRRVNEGILNLFKKMKEAQINDAVIVCHGGIIRSAAHLHTGESFDMAMKVPYLSVHRMRMPVT